MTDDSLDDVAPETAKPTDPSEGWSEDAKRILAEHREPSREERASALVSEMEHAAKHNAPVTGHMMAEMRALLMEEPVAEMPPEETPAKDPPEAA